MHHGARAYMPPSPRWFEPVTNSAAGLTMYVTARPMSAGRANAAERW